MKKENQADWVYTIFRIKETEIKCLTRFSPSGELEVEHLSTEEIKEFEEAQKTVLGQALIKEKDGILMIRHIPYAYVCPFANVKN